MRKIYIAVVSALLTMSFASCDDFLSEYSQDMVVAKTVTHLDEVLLGSVYVPTQEIVGPSGPSGGRLCGFMNIMDDDVNTVKGGTYIDEFGEEQTMKTAVYEITNQCVGNVFGYFAWQAEIGVNQDRSNVADDNKTWDDLYKRINYVNVILDEIVDMPHETEEDDAAYYRVQGEAHFLRAQFYFILANLYGKPYDAACATNLCVPLKLTPYVEHENNKDTQFERATVKQVYDQIVADLILAEQHLTKSPQKAKNRLHRASAEAAGLLLSRVYLYMQEWDLAEQAADRVLKTQNFHLAALGLLKDDVDFLTEDNPEVIFSQGPNNLPMQRGDGHFAFCGWAGAFCVSNDLGKLYDQENDRRYTSFFGKAIGDSLALENKFKSGYYVKSRVSDVFGLRLAEAYLNKAEACAMQSGKEAAANSCLNDLRAQRIDNYVNQNYTGEELVNQIRDERRKELCFEGHRWFDLRRYGVNSQYPLVKPIIHTFHVADADGGHKSTRTYRLEPNDLAYTFAIPAKVLEFDHVPMPNNEREKRESLEEMGEIVEEEETESEE